MPYSMPCHVMSCHVMIFNSENQHVQQIVISPNKKMCSAHVVPYSRESDQTPCTFSLSCGIQNTATESAYTISHLCNIKHTLEHAYDLATPVLKVINRTTYLKETGKFPYQYFHEVVFAIKLQNECFGLQKLLLDDTFTK